MTPRVGWPLYGRQWPPVSRPVRYAQYAGSPYLVVRTLTTHTREDL